MVNKWKVAGIVLCYWISMSIISRILWETTHQYPPEVLLYMVWSSCSLIAAIFFAIVRKKWNVFFIGLVPYLIASLPLIGPIVVLSYIGYQTYMYEKEKFISTNTTKEI